MLAFYLNNKPFALAENNSIRLTWRNPACNMENFPGDVGLGIDIPANEINRTLLGNPETFDRYSKENVREFEGFEIRFQGVRLMSGTYIIETADEESYSGWLRSDAGNLGEYYRERYIYDSLSFNQEKTFENKASYDPDSDEYACPKVYNPDFFKEKGEKLNVIRLRPNPNYGKLIFEWKWSHLLKIDDREKIPEEVEVEDYTEAFLKNAGYAVNQLNPDGTVKTEGSLSEDDPESIVENLKVTVVSPMLFLNYVVKTLFSDARFGIRNNFLTTDDNLKKLVVYNNYDITQIEHLKTEGTLIYLDYDDFNNDPLADYVEQLDKIGYTVSHIKRHVNTFFYKSLLPKIKLKNFILGTGNNLNVFFHFLPGRRVVDIIDRESILTDPAIDVRKYLLGYWTINEEKDSTLKFTFDHDGNDLLFSERWEDISDFRENEKEGVELWDDLEAIEDPETDEIRFVKEANGYAQYKLWLLENEDEETGETIQEKYVGWKFLTMGFQPAFFNYGKEETEEIKTDFSTLSGEDYAEVRQKGNIRSELFAFESFSPRLLFYNSGNTGSYETDELSLDWEKDTTGLLDARWKNWSRFWATRQPVETKAQFSLGMLDYAINNIYRKFRAEEGEFIVEELSTEFRTNDIGLTEIKGYKINYAPKVYTLTDAWNIDDVIWVDETIHMSEIEYFETMIGI